MQQQLHIVDEQLTTEAAPDQGGAPDVEVHAPSHFEEAEAISLEVEYGREPVRFVRALAREFDKDELVTEVRRLDEGDVDDTGDVDLADLLVFPDESLLFLGSDPTAKDAIPLFAFLIEPFEPVPAPTSVAEALDLLRPGAVRDAFEEGSEPDRQGEWWLLPTHQVPVGETYRPGVNERPFGPSPLDNHVPREWGMTSSTDEFMTGIQELVQELPETIWTPPEVIEWVNRQHHRVPEPEYAPAWEDVQELAGEILVRGTLRHRDNDHFVEDLGETWHEAKTHGMDVYTADDYIERVRLD